MPILARVIAVAILLARFTEKNFAAEFFGATSLDFLHDRAMTWRHALAVLLQVSGAIFAEDVREFIEASKRGGEIPAIPRYGPPDRQARVAEIISRRRAKAASAPSLTPRAKEIAKWLRQGSAKPRPT